MQAYVSPETDETKTEREEEGEMNENGQTGSEAPAQRPAGAKRGESAQREQPNPFETGASRRTLEELRGSAQHSDETTSRRTLEEWPGARRQTTRGSSTGGREQSTADGSASGTSQQGAAAASQVYRCLDCEGTFQSYQHECPECGAVAFETVSLESESSTEIRKEMTDSVARMTARLNPFVPR